MTTSKNIYSDHAIVTAIYSSKYKAINPRFLKIRNNKLLNKQNLCLYFDNNENLNTIFNHTDPNIIANILQVELNGIIDTISPPKIVQFSKN